MLVDVDAAAAFVDEVLGADKNQQLSDIAQLWSGLRQAYPTELSQPTHAKGCVNGDSNSRSRRENERTTIRRRSRSPSASPASSPQRVFTQQQSSTRGGVLFHCVHGTSRSATVLAAVLLHRRLCTGASWRESTQLNHDTLCMELALCNKWNYAAGVVRIVQLARPQVQPNEGFCQQLHDFHRTIERDDHER